MKRRFFRQGVASTVRLVRAVLKRLRLTGAQIASASPYEAPPFLFVQQGSVSEDEIQEKAESIWAKFGPDHTSALKNSRRYSELFFLDYLEAGDTDDVTRLKRLKLAIQCEETHTPFQNLLFKMYQRDFRGRYKDALRFFQDRYSAADLLVLHLSCRPRA